MILTLRVTTRLRSLVVKQGHPWVENYPHIAAPWERPVVESVRMLYTSTNCRWRADSHDLASVQDNNQPCAILPISL